MDIEGVRISSKCPGESHFVRRTMCNGMDGKDVLTQIKAATLILR